MLSKFVESCVEDVPMGLFDSVECQSNLYGSVIVDIVVAIWLEMKNHGRIVCERVQLFSTNAFSTNTFSPNNSSLFTLKLSV